MESALRNELETKIEELKPLEKDYKAQLAPYRKIRW